MRVATRRGESKSFRAAVRLTDPDCCQAKSKDFVVSLPGVGDLLAFPGARRKELETGSPLHFPKKSARGVTEEIR